MVCVWLADIFSLSITGSDVTIIMCKFMKNKRKRGKEKVYQSNYVHYKWKFRDSEIRVKTLSLSLFPHLRKYYESERSDEFIIRRISSHSYWLRW